MLNYVIRRLLWAGVLFAGVTLITYVLFFLLPADPARLAAGKSATAEDVARVSHQLGLDRRVRLERRDWDQPGWADALGRFDLVLANPPYVEDDAPIALAVRAWEPAGALFAFFKIIVPLLPILFFVAPGLWRNLCPLAAANQTPRVLGFTRGLTAPAWPRRSPAPSTRSN